MNPNNTDPNKGTITYNNVAGTNATVPGTDSRDVPTQLADLRSSVTQQRDSAIANIGKR